MINDSELRDLEGIFQSSDSRAKLTSLKQHLPSKDPRIITCILPHIKNEPDIKVKKAMIQSVGIVGKPEDMKKLLKLTEDPEPQVRLAMAKAIHKMGHGSFFPFLVRFLNDDNKEIKNFCGQKLTELGTDKLVALLNSMWEIPMDSMQIAALTAARQFKTPALVPLLQKGLASDKPELSSEAQKGIERLAKYGVTEAKEILGSPQSAAGKPSQSSTPRKRRSQRNVDIESPSPGGNTQSCPHCGEQIRYEALKCRYCKGFIDEESLNAVLHKEQSKNAPTYYLANRATRLAAYYLDFMPAMFAGIIPILGSTAGGVFLMARDGFEGGRYSFKNVCGLKVIDVNTGKPATLEQSFIRNCNYIPTAASAIALVPLLGALALMLVGLITMPIYLIDCFMVALGYRRITDRFAGTTVVQTENAGTPTWAKIVLAVFFLAPVGLAVIGIAFAALAGAGSMG